MNKALNNGLKSENSLLGPYFISKEWLHKLKYFGEPGPIDNSDFLCIHNKVQPNVWKIVENITVMSSYDSWNYLVSTFGFKSLDKIKKFDHDVTDHGVCNYFYPCEQCQIDDEEMKRRQLIEKNEFIRLRERYNKQCLQISNQSARLYAISSSWFKQWESFVQFNGCPSIHQVPGPINNMPISQVSKINPKEHFLNKSGNFYKLNEEMWKYLYNIYGGGPILPINNINSKLKHQTENCSKI
jgi:ubiquitin carboxyl-terminal hydrolase 20/33